MWTRDVRGRASVSISSSRAPAFHSLPLYSPPASLTSVSLPFTPFTPFLAGRRTVPPMTTGESLIMVPGGREGEGSANGGVWIAPTAGMSVMGEMMVVVVGVSLMYVVFARGTMC